MYVSIGKAARLLGVSASTLRRWEAEKKLFPAFRTPGKHRRYKLTTLLEFTKQLSPKQAKPLPTKKPRSRVVAYARVSGSKQQGDLGRQITHLQDYVHQHGWTLLKLYKDIGSGLNDHRPGLLQLLQDLPLLQPDLVVCTYEDRLARFGTKLIETICAYFSTQICVTQKKLTPPSLEEQVMKDVIAVITSFAGKLHRARRGTLSPTISRKPKQKENKEETCVGLTS